MSDEITPSHERQRLRPTFEPNRARLWRKPGGPWDSGTLQQLTPSGSHLAVVDGPIRMDADRFSSAVDDLAQAMSLAGVRRYQVVAWQVPNSAAALLMFWACWRIGAVAAPLHRRLGASEVNAALEQVGPSVVVAQADISAAGIDGALVLEASSVASGADGIVELFRGAGRVGSTGLVGPAGRVGSTGLVGPAGRVGIGPAGRGGVGASGDRSVSAAPVRGSDIAVVLFTSGSSGIPKAVLHTHRALAYKAKLMAQVHGLRDGDPVLAPAPLAHVSGLLNGVLISAAVNGPCVLIEPWDPEVGLRLLDEERIAFMGAPPIFFSQMSGLPGFTKEKVSALQLISTGGASVSPAFVDSTAEAFGCRVKRTYGSTEAPTVTTSGPGDPFERARETDGHAVGVAEVEVHDPESGLRLAAGEVGELWIRGPELFAGYADPVKTASVIVRPGGWFRSGDLGSVDADGWLRVTGRLSDTIIRAGENISASEVEAALEAHPLIRNAVAVPVPDSQVGERVAAFVVLVTPGEFGLSECREWFVERGITRFKTPELVIPIDAIPTLAAGKPDRTLLKEMAERVARGDG